MSDLAHYHSQADRIADLEAQVVDLTIKYERPEDRPKPVQAPRRWGCKMLPPTKEAPTRCPCDNCEYTRKHGGLLPHSTIYKPPAPLNEKGREPCDWAMLAVSVFVVASLLIRGGLCYV